LGEDTASPKAVSIRYDPDPSSLRSVGMTPVTTRK
jgi:hypothetical protein